MFDIQDFEILFEERSVWSKVIEDETIIKIIIEAIPNVYENYLNSQGFGCFSCCSRYKECSDAQKCLHPNRLIANVCFTRVISNKV